MPHLTVYKIRTGFENRQVRVSSGRSPLIRWNDGSQSFGLVGGLYGVRMAGICCGGRNWSAAASGGRCGYRYGGT